jgi:subtilisin family serine protease
MRLGGMRKWPSGPKFLRRTVVALTTAGVALVAATPPATAVDPSVAHAWAITRSPDGHLHVVRGLAAARARMDREVGRTSTDVLTYEQDVPVHADYIENDPRRPEQWALDRVPYEAVWGATKFGAGMTVAVVDTGVEAAHEDLAGSVVAGTDLAGDQAQVDPADNGMVDPGGHGTHVAGIIAAHANNGRGIVGAAPGAHIMPVRVLDAHGSGTSSGVADGVIWAADHGARVINLSLGGGPSDGMRTAIQYARSKNALVFAAAGNGYQSGNTPTYPAAYPEAIAVAAVDSNLNHASFSNSGSYVDIAAPGDMILSTYGGSTPNDYEYMAGTSMATPYAAAEAALLMAENPNLTNDRVEQIMESTASDLGSPGRDDFFGYGLVNPRSAALAASPTLNQGTKGNGYWVVTIDGQVRPFGHAAWYGDMHGKWHTGAIIAAAPTPSGHGYWLAGTDGAVYTFGDAHYFGSMYGRHLNGRIMGMAATPSGNGYLLLGEDGGIFRFGDAGFYGSTGGMRLNAPVLDMAMTSTGHGYWLVAADGGVFRFGDAVFHGSTGGRRLAAPVRSMTASSDGSGYWMVAEDGGIFTFNVPFKGSLPSVRSMYGMPYVSSERMRAIPTNDGYYILGVNGNVYAFGEAKYWGSAPGTWAVDIMQMP